MKDAPRSSNSRLGPVRLRQARTAGDPVDTQHGLLRRHLHRPCQRRAAACRWTSPALRGIGRGPQRSQRLASRRQRPLRLRLDVLLTTCPRARTPPAAM
ncbi:hypothetical protein ACRAWF_46290 [Streptomyces sp. L7]